VNLQKKLDEVEVVSLFSPLPAVKILQAWNRLYRK